MQILNSEMYGSHETPQHPVDIFSGFNMAIVLLALFANSVVLRAVSPRSIALVSHRRFLQSLFISNLFICSLDLLLIGMTITQGATSLLPKCVFEIIKRLSITGFIANLLSLMALATDHFVAIVKPIDYKRWTEHDITKKAVFVIWLFAIFASFCDFPFRTVHFFVKNNQPVVEIPPTDTECGGMADVSYVLDAL